MAKLKIEVFTSPTCPHCPGAVRATEELLNENPGLKDKVSWMEMSTGSPQGRAKANAYGIRSVPTVILTRDDGETMGYRGAPTQRIYKKMVDEMLK